MTDDEQMDGFWGSNTTRALQQYHLPPPSGTSLGPELSLVVISWEADKS